MNNQEAIKTLRELRRETNDSWYEEVYDKAISALQAQNIPDTNIRDTISRQTAIDTLAKQMPCLYTLDGSHPADEGIFMAQEIYADCIVTIEKLPSAQPEQRWIPVSERMPEDGENCLVSVRCSNNFLVDRGTYSTDLFNVDEEDFFGNRGESGWYYLSSEYGYCKILNVIAWMPLPEPYRAERRTDELGDS